MIRKRYGFRIESRILVNKPLAPSVTVASEEYTSPVHYQRKVDARRAAIAAMEALREARRVPKDIPLFPVVLPVYR